MQRARTSIQVAEALSYKQHQDGIGRQHREQQRTQDRPGLTVIMHPVPFEGSL